MTRGFRRTGRSKDATFRTWWNQAVCRRFPGDLREPLWDTASEWRQAGRMLCQACPVRNWCLATALTQRLWGDQALRGGLTYRERATLKRDIEKAGLHIFDSGMSQEAQAIILKDWITDRRIDAAKLETSAMWRDYKRNKPAKRRPGYRQAAFDFSTPVTAASGTRTRKEDMTTQEKEARTRPTGMTGIPAPSPGQRIRGASRLPHPLLALEYRARCAGTRVWDTPQALLLWTGADDHYDHTALMRTEIREGMRYLRNTGLRLHMERRPDRIVLTGPATRLMSAETMRRALVGLDLLNGSYRRIASVALRAARTVPGADCVSFPDLRPVGSEIQVIRKD